MNLRTLDSRPALDGAGTLRQSCKSRLKTSKSGQSSMEYITTYGWAVLVVGIVGIVIWQLGILDFSSRFAPGSSGFSILVPLDWEMNGACDLSLQMSNGAGEPLQNMRIGSDNCTPSYIEAGDYAVCSKNFPNCGGAGSAYEESIIVTYERAADNESFQTAGRIWGNVGG